MANIQELSERIEKLALKAALCYEGKDMFKQEVLAINAQLEQLLQNEQELSKKERVELYFLKGKVLDILPDYSKQAEETLSKAVKLNPTHCESLNILGHILWKKQDFQGAQQCFKTVIEKEPNNIEGLQHLSMVLRQTSDGKDRSENFAKSLAIAKQALLLDLQNSYSWYLVGNAYMSDYFTNPKKQSEQLNQALQAYNQSEKYQISQNPDLYFNRANVLCIFNQILTYFEDYQQAFKDYETANKIDKSLGLTTLQDVQSRILCANDLIQNRAKMAHKKLANIIRSIPTGLKYQPQFNKQLAINSISELKEGVNKDKLFVCKSLVNYTNSKIVPAGFVVADSQMEFAALSLYHISQDIYDKIRENTELYIVDPVLKVIFCTINDQIIQYRCIQVKNVDNFYVENEKIINQFVPSQVVNQTFEK